MGIPQGSGRGPGQQEGGVEFIYAILAVYLLMGCLCEGLDNRKEGWNLCNTCSLFADGGVGIESGVA